jgi:hypothetical protein
VSLLEAGDTWPSRLDGTLVQQSTLMGREARLSLIAAAVIGAMELASELPDEAGEGLRKSLFLGALRALELREKARRELREASCPSPGSDSPQDVSRGRSYR